MIFKKLFTKWCESLEIFKPKNLKLFVLASLNTARRSLIILFKNCWWMIPFLLIPFFLSILSVFILKFVPVSAYSIKLYQLPIVFFSVLPFILLTFCVFLAVRPSIETKNIYYFFSFFKKVWAFLILGVLQAGISFYAFGVANLFPVFWLAVLFFLDSKGKISSLYYSLLNGIRSVIFYLPVFFLLGLINLGRFALGDYFSYKAFYFNSYFRILGFGLNIIVAVFLEILFLSFLTVYYIKIKHKDFHFFYRK